MGLDISAYRKVTPAPGEWLDKNGELSEDREGENFTQLYPNPDFPEHAEGVPEGELYAYEESMGFRAGSYSGYSQWREWLANVVGKTCDQYWAGAKGPFAELINFSDCEGLIGPAIAAKLAKDFAEWDERAKQADEDDGYFYERYVEWRRACEMAADGGAISFH